MTSHDEPPTPPGLAQAIRDALEVKRSRLVLEVDGRQWTGRSFLEQANARCLQLRDAGLIPGDAVLVQSGRGGDFWIDVFAVWACGGVYAPVGDAISLDQAVRLVRPRFLLGASLMENVPEGVNFLAGPPAEGTETLPAIKPPTPDSLSTILFTSGSTGQPKGVRLSDGGLLANARATLQCLDLRPDDVLFAPIAFRFVSALSHFVTVMLSDAALAATEAPLLPNSLAASVASNGATCLGGSPIHARWLVETEAGAFTTLRWIMSSGDNLSSATIASLATLRPDLGVYTFYGLTELAGRFCWLGPQEQATHMGSVGRPIPGFSLALVDDGDAPCFGNQIGEVIAKGPGLMLGYCGDTQATDKAIGFGGFRTGDLGYLDDDGLLHLVGRKDDVFKVMGLKAHAMTIQDAVMASGLVEDAAVLPFEDDRIGTAPCVYLVEGPAMGYSKGAMMRHLRSALPNHMLPRKFITVRGIPRTSSGKVDRTALRDLAQSLEDD
jgi:acyl-coenzyme A synthetase/AMP-(fatty) acid ligase